MEEKYWELREAVDRAWDTYNRKLSSSAELAYHEALEEYQIFCVNFLEIIMNENSDVLARLKK